MTSNETRIDLKDYIPEGTNTLSGRPWGVAVRNLSDIGAKVRKHDRVTIVIPRDISSVTPSFLEEFLEDVLLELGEERFLQKVQFESQGRYKINADLKLAIGSILRQEIAYSY